MERRRGHWLTSDKNTCRQGPGYPSSICRPIGYGKWFPWLSGLGESPGRLSDRRPGEPFAGGPDVQIMDDFFEWRGRQVASVLLKQPHSAELVALGGLEWRAVICGGAFGCRCGASLISPVSFRIRMNVSCLSKS